MQRLCNNQLEAYSAENFFSSHNKLLSSFSKYPRLSLRICCPAGLDLLPRQVLLAKLLQVKIKFQVADAEIRLSRIKI